MSLAANAIVSLNDAKTYLLEGANTNDSVIEGMINSISTLLESESGGPIVKQTFTSFRINGNGCRSINLPLTPVQSVASIAMRDFIDDSTDETVATDAFIVTNKNTGRVLLVNDIFPLGIDNIAITFDAGWNTTDLEFGVFVEACKRQVKYDYVRWQHQEIGVQARSIHDGSVSFGPSHGLLLEVIELIRPLKRQHLYGL